jgi:RND family efflux transporter MFP subunit
MANKTDAGASKLYTGGVVALALAGATVFYFHFARDQELSAVREAKALVAERGPRIEVVTTSAGPELRTIKLLGDVRSGATATLYAKVAGYLKAIYVDKGDKVEAGQLLAEIESPEIEQQYAAASADLVNKRRNYARIKDLFSRGNTTQVALYQAETDATVAENNVGVLATSIAYKSVKAPFAGRVTARFADPGALVSNAQTNFMSAMPMVTISDDSKVRVYAYLQQADVPFVKLGDAAEVSDASNPERTRTATVTRMTGELDAKTRTMLIEVHIDNHDNFFVPGSFAYLTLQVKVQSYPQIPVTALITRANENVVAVLDKDVVHFRPVKVATTDGAVVSLLDGLAPGEKIAINVPDEVTNGSRIQPIESTATARAR